MIFCDSSLDIFGIEADFVLLHAQVLIFEPNVGFTLLI